MKWFAPCANHFLLPMTASKTAAHTTASFPALLVALLLTLVSWVGCTPTPPPTPAALPDPSRLDPQLRSVLETQLRIVSEKPGDPERHATLGLICAANDLWAPALQCFSNVMALAPDEPHGVLYAGVAAQESGLPDTASALYKRLVQEHGAFAPGWYRLGEFSLKNGALPEAEAAFQKLVQLAPGEWRGPAGLGEIALRQGNPSAAIAHLKRALDLDPSAGTAHHLLGQSLQRTGQTNEAIWHQALGRNSTGSPMPDAWASQASQYTLALTDQFAWADKWIASGQSQRALHLLRETLRFHPGDPSVINHLAITLNRAGQPDQAKLLLSDLLSKDPSHLAAWVSLSFAEAQLTHFKEALDAANHAIALNTNVAQPFLARANACLGMEQDQDAVDSFLLAARADPSNPEILLELADVLHHNLRRGPEALTLVHQARALNPTFPAIYPRLAQLELAFGSPDGARAAVETLRRLQPRSPDLPALERALTNRAP